jgi:hypothetical protein
MNYPALTTFRKLSKMVAAVYRTFAACSPSLIFPLNLPEDICTKTPTGTSNPVKK